MKVVQLSMDGYAQDPTKYFHFSRYAKDCGNFVLIERAFEAATLWNQFHFTEEDLRRLRKQKIVRLEFEEPNKFFIGDDPNTYDDDFYRVFTLCPYTTEYLNRKQGVKRRVPIFFPFNEEYVPPKAIKKYDIIYTGHIVSSIVLRDIKTIARFNYRFVSNSRHSLVTDPKASYEGKMQRISESKITLVHNLLYPRLYHLFNIWRVSDWQHNGAFRLIPQWYEPWKLFGKEKILVPQLKSRVFEAAFGRSLILCKRDPFNVIERYFDPGKEFVYFEEGQLEERIREILQNYGKYQPIIDAAFRRAKRQYTTKAFMQNYLKKLR